MFLRIVGPLMSLVVVVLVVLVVPVLLGISSDRTGQVELERRVAMDRIADLARTATDSSQEPLRQLVDQYQDLYGESVLVVDGTGEVVVSAGDLHPGDARVQRRTRDFGYNVPDLTIDTVTPWSDRTTLLSVPVESGSDLATGLVLMEVDLGPARSQVRRDWGLIVGSAFVAMLLLLGASARTARWVIRPVADLEGAALALAAQRETPDLAVTGPPELRRLGRAFQTMSTALTLALKQQRDLLARTSHQLRNPLAAAQLQLDLLSSRPGPSDERIGTVQENLDRMETTLDRLLGIAEAEHRVAESRAPRLTAEIEADRPGTRAEDIATHVDRRWGRTSGLRLVIDATPGLVLDLPPADAVEIVDTVVENAVKYAGPEATVRVTVAVDGPADDAGDDAAVDLVMIRVEDDGEGLTDSELAHAAEQFWRSSRHAEQPGTGLGLAIVDALARAAAGSMTVGRSELGGFEVTVRVPRGGRRGPA